jgi:hypothetical protein
VHLFGVLMTANVRVLLSYSTLPLEVKDIEAD